MGLTILQSTVSIPETLVIEDYTSQSEITKGIWFEFLTDHKNGDNIEVIDQGENYSLPVYGGAVVRFPKDWFKLIDPFDEWWDNNSWGQVGTYEFYKQIFQAGRDSK